MRLKDIAYINRRVLSETTDPDYAFKYIDIASVNDLGKIAIPGQLTLFGQAPSRARRLAPTGSTVISTVRTYLRAIAQVPSSYENLIFSTGFAVLESKPSVDDRFLAYVCRSQPFINEVVARSVGVSYPAINPGDLASIGVPVPPLDEQRRIAAFLDTETARVDRLVELRTAQIDAVSARYHSRLSLLAEELTDRYGAVKVRHVLQKIEQGWSPQCEDRPITNGEWGVVKAGCVNNGVFDATQHKALPEGTEPELKYRLRPGDLLMSRASGSAELIGSIAVLPEGIPERLLLCDKVYRLHMDWTRMAAEFVAFMLRTLEVREQIKLGISGAEGMANNLPTATVTNLPLPDLPLSEQGQVVSELSDAWQTVQETIHALKQQLIVLAERRQALITAAVTGGITV